MRRGGEGGSGGPGALRQRSDRYAIAPIHLSRGRTMQARAMDELRARGWELLGANPEHVTFSRPGRRHEYVFLDVYGRMRRGRTVPTARSVTMRALS